MIHGFDNPYQFDMALMDPVFTMMQRGIRIDMEKRSAFQKEYYGLWDKYQKDLNSLAGWEVNVNSNPQCKTLLYEQFGLPVRRKKKKVTADEDAIRASMAYCDDKARQSKQHATIQKYQLQRLSLFLVLKTRAVRKRISSYIDVEIDEDLRMRSTLTIGGTETFRFSSSKTLWDTGCNMQTIPRKLRSMFIADDGYEIAEFDLNRGESWIYAHLSAEPEMMRIHEQGLDFHTITGLAIAGAFGMRDLPRLEDWKEWAKAHPQLAYKIRFLGKKTNHASAYQMGPFRFVQEVNKEADDTGITIVKRQAAKAQTLWKRKYRYIKTWWDNIEKQLNEDRTLVTPYGRRQTFHDRWGDELFKSATAYVPQSTSVDYINGGLLRVFNELERRGSADLQILHQNHDSIVLQYKHGHRAEVVPAVIDLIESVVLVNDYHITIPVEAQYGHSWGELAEYAA